MSDSDVPLGLDKLPKYWPIILGFVAIVGAGAQVQAKVENLETRADRAENIAAELSDRLARIEENQKTTLHSVRRIEALLDGRNR